MFAYRAVILACLFLFVDDDRGTVSLARAATEERHTTVGYNGDAAHESPISHSPSVTFEDADGRQVCEGTLVTPLLVLTAASCVDDSVTGFDPSQLSVVIATVDDSASTAIGKEARIGISRIETHEAYRKGRGYKAQYDVAFVELKEPVTSAVTSSLIPESLTSCNEIDFAGVAVRRGRTVANWIGSFFNTHRLSLETIQKCTAGRETSGDGDWEKITICAFASRERGFGDLGRGILCSQGFGKPPLLVGLVTKMADTSNGDRFPLSINIPSAFLTVAANQMKVNANQNKMIPHLRTGVPADEGTFPYAVSIWPTGVLHFCNGALISSKHVLTVASCVERAYRYPSKVICKIGDIHIHDDERCPEAESLTASKIMMSPRQGHKKGKLAIIVLETESKKAPLLLPEAGADYCKNGRDVSVYGWGPTSPGQEYSPILQQGNVRCINHETCRDKYSSKVPRLGQDELCSYNRKAGASICNRDDGTGMVMLGDNATDWSDDILIGMAGSSTKTTDCTKFPSKFIDIVPHLDWIQSVLKKEKGME